MQFRILGPIEARARDGRPVRIGAAKQRCLLAALLFRANHHVTLDRLVEALWAGDPPKAAVSATRTYVSELRQALGLAGDAGGPHLAARAGGYRLAVPPAELDALVFAELAAEGQRALDRGEAALAIDLLRRALDLWRGRPAEDVTLHGWLVPEAARLSARRLAAQETCIEARLALGQHTELLPELRSLVAVEPFAERLWAQLMLALHRCGRRSEALAAFGQLRRRLADDLGAQPGAPVRLLHRQILAADPALDPPLTAVVTTRPASRTPDLLPATDPTFTGRAVGLGQLDAAAPVAVITGRSGAGKTALAVHWAHHVRSRFPDGQLYADLRGLPPARALAGLLRAFGMPAGAVPVEEAAAAAAYRDIVAGKRVLVVLDGARDAAQVRPLLPGGAGCLAVVTSRDPLADLVAEDGAEPVVLGGLAVGDARVLLARVLGRARTAAEPDAVAELAAACDHLPLALRIAAAHLRDRPQLGIAGYVAELRAADRPADAVIEVAYAALPPPARRLLRLLGLVPGPDVTADATAVLVGATPTRAAQLLDRLAAAHLVVEARPGRYALHEPVRAYVAGSDVDTTARRRLLAWYERGAEAAAHLLHPHALRLSPGPAPPERRAAPEPARFDRPGRALAWVDAEHANLLAAAGHAARHGPPSVAWRLADALRSYAGQRMPGADWLALAEAGLAAAETDGHLDAQAAMHLALADCHLRHTRYRLAIGRYARALALTRRTGWLPGQAAALGKLGTVLRRSGQPRAAARHHTSSLALDQQTGRLVGQAHNLYNLGLAYRDLGLLRLAADHYGRALALYRTVGSRRGAATLGKLGEVTHVLGRPDRALDHLARALAGQREAGDRHREADTLRTIATVHRDTGRGADALASARAALALARDAVDHRAEASALNTLGTICHQLGHHGDAVEHHQQALVLARRDGARYGQAEALIGLAAAHHHLDHPDVALACAREAHTSARRRGYRVLEGDALTVLAGLALTAGDATDAVERAREALGILRETGHRLGQARTLLVLGDALDRAGDPAGREHGARARPIHAEIGSPPAAPGPGQGWPHRGANGATR